MVQDTDRIGDVGSYSPMATKPRSASNTTARSPGAPSWLTDVIDAVEHPRVPAAHLALGVAGDADRHPAGGRLGQAGAAVEACSRP